MDNRQWVAAGYPAGICCFAILCLFVLHVPHDDDDEDEDEEGITSKPSKIAVTTTPTETKSLSPQTQKDIDLRPPSEAENCQADNVPKRLSLWFAAFWLTLQYYALLRMSSMIQVAQREQPGFIWVAMVALFLSTLVVWISAGKLAGAIGRFEAHHERLNGDPKVLSILSRKLVGSSLLLLFVPWVQVICVLVWS